MQNRILSTVAWTEAVVNGVVERRKRENSMTLGAPRATKQPTNNENEETSPPVRTVLGKPERFPYEES